VLWRIVAVGKPKLEFARLGIAEYAARLEKFGEVEFVAVKASNKDQESAALLEKSGGFRLVLDGRGKALTSEALSDKVRDIRESGRSVCSVIVGGADGLSATVTSRADLLWALGPLTLQHEMALLLALEQLYRAHTILAGFPYHRP